MIKIKKTFGKYQIKTRFGFVCEIFDVSARKSYSFTAADKIYPWNINSEYDVIKVLGI